MQDWKLSRYPGAMLPDPSFSNSDLLNPSTNSWTSGIASFNSLSTPNKSITKSGETEYDDNIVDEEAEGVLRLKPGQHYHFFHQRNLSCLWVNCSGPPLKTHQSSTDSGVRGRPRQQLSWILIKKNTSRTSLFTRIPGFTRIQVLITKAVRESPHATPWVIHHTLWFISQIVNIQVRIYFWL